MEDMMRDFGQPDWYAPLDLAARLQAVPKDLRIKGMFFKSALRQAGIREADLPASQRYVAFKDYPVRDLISVLAQCAPKAHPGVPQREAVRRLGHHAFKYIMDSTVAQVIFTMARQQLRFAVQLVSKMYDAVTRTGTVRVCHATDTMAVIELRGLWVFPDAYHVGVYEEAMRHFEQPGRVLVRVHSLSDVDVLLDWGGAS